MGEETPREVQSVPTLELPGLWRRGGHGGGDRLIQRGQVEVLDGV